MMSELSDLAGICCILKQNNFGIAVLPDPFSKGLAHARLCKWLARANNRFSAAFILGVSVGTYSQSVFVGIAIHKN